MLSRIPTVAGEHGPLAQTMECCARKQFSVPPLWSAAN